MNVFVAAVIRAIMLGIGVLTGQDGWRDESFIQTVSGVAITLAALIWSMMEKRRLIQRGQSPSAKVRLREKSEKASPVEDKLLGRDPHERRRAKQS